jgi:hypothetical protein
VSSRPFVALSLVSLVLGFGSLAAAGNLKASLHGKSLSLTGDSAGVSATLTSVPDGMTDPSLGLVRIIPDPGTTVNGSAAAAGFSGVENVSVKLGNAINAIDFETLTVAGNLKVKGGKLDDVLDVHGGSFKTVTLDGSGGENHLGCSLASIAGNVSYKTTGANPQEADFGCTADGSLSFKLGTGHDVVEVDDGASAKSLSVSTGPAFDQVTVGAAEIETDVKISLNHGANEAVFHGAVVGGKLSVTTLGGADNVRFQPITVGEAVKVTLGTGANIVMAGMGPSLIGESLSISLGTGADKVNLDQLTTGTDLSIKVGEGANQITLTNLTVGDNLTVLAGKGDDHMTFGTNMVNGTTKISLGAGNNVCTSCP